MKINIKLIAIILGVLAVVLVLSGCSTTNTEPKPVVTVTETYEPPAPEPVYGDEELFISDMRSVGNWIIDENTDADLIELGWGVCGVLDEGYSVDDILWELIGSGTVSTDSESEFAAALIAYAIYDLCPEHTDEVEAYF